MEKLQILAEIKKVVLQNDPEADIILYGSYARGDYYPDSDIDILILLNKEKVTNEDEKKITHPLYDLELSFSKVISPLIKSKKTWYELYPNTALFLNIKKEGKRI